MTQSDLDFFALLNAGLTQTPSNHISTSPDWDYIYTLASQQTVTGIISDGISVMNLQPSLPNSILSRFTDDTVSIIRRNAEINIFQSRITDFLTNNNIKHFVVKGQEAALNYPHPNLRSAGDIDLILPPDHYQRAKLLLADIADSIQPEILDELHASYFFSDIDVELHGTFHSLIGSHTDLVSDRIQSDLFDGVISFHTFHTILLFTHILKHFCYGGIGIRQIADFRMHLIRHNDNIDLPVIHSYLNQMHLTREWHIFTAFASLTTSADRFTATSRTIWNECKLRGNFGHNTRDIPRTGGFLLRNTRTLLSLFSRFHHYRHTLPTVRFHQLRKDLSYYFSIVRSRL